MTGSAITSIDFSGLDINTHKSYRVEIELINATASFVTIYSFINGDTTLTNYYNQLLQSNGAKITSARTNNPTVAEVSASIHMTANITVNKTSNNYAFIGSKYTIGAPASCAMIIKEIQKVETVTNITQLTFTSDVASGIGIGSKIRIYRGDV